MKNSCCNFFRAISYLILLDFVYVFRYLQNKSVTEVGDAVGDELNLPHYYHTEKQMFNNLRGRW